MFGNFASRLSTRNICLRFSSRLQSPVLFMSLKTRVHILRLPNVALSGILLIREFINSFLWIAHILGIHIPIGILA